MSPIQRAKQLSGVGFTFCLCRRKACIFIYLYAITLVIYGGSPNTETYDFIIVGAGAAGSVLANRLSENPSWKVLLLEAGVVPDFMADVPALAPLQQFTKYNWKYCMEKEKKFAYGLKDKIMDMPSGKGLGGSTLINFNIYMRGNQKDYDRWAEQGNAGWSFNDVLPYFKKSEDSSVRVQDNEYRHSGGELPVQDVAFRTKYVDAFIDACEQSGYPYVDYNGARQMGASYIQATTKDELSWSAEKAFLRPVKNRTNLAIRTSSQATKILIDRKTKQACAIKYVTKGIKCEVKASKEIIISAGPFNSPHLLMLSGIGPKPELKKFKIPVVKNLPVGQIMYDHLFFGGLIFTVNETLGYNFTSLVDPCSFVQLHHNGTGPLGLLGVFEGVAFLQTNTSADSDQTYPDMELIFAGGHLNLDAGKIYKKMFRLSDKIYDALWKPLEGQFAIGIFPLLLRPKSYGCVQLRSAKPLDPPKLHGNYYADSNRSDIKTMIAGIREAQKIFKAPAFQKYGATQVNTPIPGCEACEFDSNDYWECALRYMSHTLYHQTTTCKMGQLNDTEAVVNNRLRVYGVKGLRVADSSVIPMPLTGHVLAPTYMIGERAAAMIKEDWETQN